MVIFIIYPVTAGKGDKKTMGRNIFVGIHSGLLPAELDFEIAERKGAGHPDTLCDLVVEEISKTLCEFYIDKLGAIMHHNVDKALLVGGAAEPCFGGGRVTTPMEIIVAGRAIAEADGEALPVYEISKEAIRRVLGSTLIHMDAEKHAVSDVKIRHGSRDLIELFERFGAGEVPLSNDTSAGAGFYPLDRLENAVYMTEKFLNSPAVKSDYPFIGEDIKVMGVRDHEKITLTIALAVVDRYIASLGDYREKLSLVKDKLLHQDWIDSGTDIYINTADDYERGSIYLTVTGTSAEGGDDGQVGRGNRTNGLITPYRPMTLEAAAGKNPVSHVGKLYNLFAGELCRKIVDHGLAPDAYACMVSQIGKPINDPQILDVKAGGSAPDTEGIKRLAGEMLRGMPLMWEKIIKGEYGIV